MKFHIRTYGCQMNKRDSESVSSLLQRHGWTHSVEDDADLVLVNTCSVRGKAEDKALGKLGLMVASKRTHENRIVGVIGCMVQRRKDQLFEKVPGLDFAVGTHRLSAIPAIVDCVQAGQGPVLDADEEGGFSEELCGHEEGGISAFVNILFGCDRRCAYCIVPSVRGGEWSRPAAGIISEVTSLAAAGVKEVTLLGQSVTLYGRKNSVWPDDHHSEAGFKDPLPRLLEAVNNIDGISRVRFTSGHPEGCSDELVGAMAVLPAVCEHLHLPFQSGSDRILKAMRRGYTSDGYSDVVARLRSAMPGIALTTDVIVGFPGETQEDFQKTSSFMREIGFDNAFIFKYSPRPGTPAADWNDDVPDDEKQRRNHVLLADQDVTGLAINEKLIGHDVEVLVEGEGLRNSDRWSGRTRTNKIVVFPPREGVERGNVASVRIERAMAQTIYGTVV